MGMYFAFCRTTRLISRGGFVEDLQAPADGIASGNLRVRLVVVDIGHRTKQSADGHNIRTTYLANTRQHVDRWPKVSDVKDR